jgi:hypothetical protein
MDGGGNTLRLEVNLKHAAQIVGYMETRNSFPF